MKGNSGPQRGLSRDRPFDNGERKKGGPDNKLNKNISMGFRNGVTKIL